MRTTYFISSRIAAIPPARGRLMFLDNSETPYSEPPSHQATVMDTEQSLMDTEQSLVEKARRGDEKALDVLLSQHRQRILGYCRRWVSPPPDDAEDVTQLVGIRAFRSIQSYKGEGPFANWLMAMATNACKDWLKARQRRRSGDEILQTLLQRDAEVRVNEEHKIEEAEAIAHFLEELKRKLCEEDYQVFIRLMEGDSKAEIARLMGVSRPRITERGKRVHAVATKLWKKLGNS